jgi:hypothetical protein
VRWKVVYRLWGVTILRVRVRVDCLYARFNDKNIDATEWLHGLSSVVPKSSVSKKKNKIMTIFGWIVSVKIYLTNYVLIFSLSIIIYFFNQMNFIISSIVMTVHLFILFVLNHFFEIFLFDIFPFDIFLSTFRLSRFSFSTFFLSTFFFRHLDFRDFSFRDLSFRHFSFRDFSFDFRHFSFRHFSIHSFTGSFYHRVLDGIR